MDAAQTIILERLNRLWMQLSILETIEKDLRDEVVKVITEGAPGTSAVREDIPKLFRPVSQLRIVDELIIKISKEQGELSGEYAKRWGEEG